MTQATFVRLLPHRADSAAEAFAHAVLAGLSARPRSIPARFFYDDAGSALFEQITRLPEYYPTRTEAALLAAHAPAIANAVGRGRVVVEFGSGSSAKTPLLLGSVAPSAYVPIDISGDFLRQSAAALGRAHPGLRVLPVVGDFSHRIDLPVDLHGQPMLGFFPGSTIGNFAHPEAVDLLRAFRETLGEGAWLVIGLDTRKNPARLTAAYDDAAGVTAAFNLNLLHRINRELDGAIPVDRFAHVALWNEAPGRIEMHLRAIADVSFTVLGRRFSVVRGETIHTENSYKYRPEEARLLARSSGWQPIADWTDPERLFGLHLWRAEPQRLQP